MSATRISAVVIWSLSLKGVLQREYIVTPLWVSSLTEPGLAIPPNCPGESYLLASETRAAQGGSAVAVLASAYRTANGLFRLC